MKQFLITLLAILFLLSQTISVYGATYEYDDLDRVTRVIYEDGSSVSYTYDANGNVVGIEHSGESPNEAEQPNEKPSQAGAKGDGAGENGRNVAISGMDAGDGAGDSVTSGEDILQEVQNDVSGAANVRDKISGMGEQNELRDADKGIGGTSEPSTEASADKTTNFILVVIASGVMGVIVLQKIKSEKQTKEKAGNEVQGDKNEDNDME